MYCFLPVGGRSMVFVKFYDGNQALDICIVLEEDHPIVFSAIAEAGYTIQFL